MRFCGGNQNGSALDADIVRKVLCEVKRAAVKTGSGVYTSKLKLIEGYRRIMDGNVRCHPFSNSPRKPVIYRFPVDEFVGETPEWNDGKLYTDDLKYEISIGELEGNLSLEAGT